MIVGLNHIAIAVPDFEQAIERFLLDFGLNYPRVLKMLCLPRRKQPSFRLKERKSN